MFLGICLAPTPRISVPAMPHGSPFPTPPIVEASMPIIFAVAGLCRESDRCLAQASGLIGRDPEGEARPSGDVRE
jgi:hypothetical protein